MIKKILVANRSEIACRIIRACRESEITAVAVYSEADEKSLHVRLADESVCIGPAPAIQSYLNMDSIIGAALDTGCDAIHPGYGFLAENPDFNRKVRQAGLIFIGPDPDPMELLGSKVEARKTMIAARVPVIPGMKSSSLKIADFEEAAAAIGYPVLIKASAGGGGKGMRIVRRAEDLQSSVESAMRESKSAFGSDEVYLEKYLDQPRHVEFQVAADNFGNAVYLFERECSIQRRHQKIIEETPSPIMDDDLQRRMGETAVKVIQTASYNNVGTVEFLVDKDRNFYFLEVNARIQVEHPITEMTTGVDLVKLQISISEGNRLPFAQSDLKQNGHAIECRIYAEDSDNNFMPSSGKILFLREAVGPGVRCDSGIYEGAQISVFYDPVLAKLIVWGANREEARKRMIISLKDNVVLGVKTSIAFMIKCLEHPDFISGATYTNFIEKNLGELKASAGELLNPALAIAALAAGPKPAAAAGFAGAEYASPWQSIGKWEICSNKL